MNVNDDAALVALFERLALEAGHAIMEVYDAGDGFELKSDDSPVTEADRRAEQIILAGVREALPGVPCVAEEEVSSGAFPEIGDQPFLLVDPLDGTKEFIKRMTDFTVNIALVRDGEPKLGVVFAPARGVLYAAAPGVATEVRVSPDMHELGSRAVHVRPRATPPVIVASRSHRTPETDEYIAGFEGATTNSAGSSLKFCMLAAGEADLYPRFGPTMQWDTAAGDAVLRAAGGMTLTLNGEPLRYGPVAGEGAARYRNPYFIASGAPAAAGEGCRGKADAGSA